MNRGDVRAILAGLSVVPNTMAIGSAITLTSVVRPPGRWMMPLGRTWSRWLLGAAGIRVLFEGLEHTRAAPALLFMANHESVLDIPAVALAMPDHLRFIAKHSIQYIPFFGWAMKASGGCIFVDRGHHARAVASLQDAATRIRSGHCVLVFPEGTRSRDGRLGEFKKGPFHLAAEAGVPVVPVAIQGTRELMPQGSLRIYSGDVRVRFGPPIPVTPDTTPATLAPQVRAALLGMLGQRED
jgi:1-acyl-sn-glycerol-3-phosphate acyltransferase